jgi:hypothetical protein
MAKKRMGLMCASQLIPALQDLLLPYSMFLLYAFATRHMFLLYAFGAFAVCLRYTSRSAASSASKVKCCCVLVGSTRYVSIYIGVAPACIRQYVHPPIRASAKNTFYGCLYSFQNISDPPTDQVWHPPIGPVPCCQVRIYHMLRQFQFSVLKWNKQVQCPIRVDLRVEGCHCV